MITTTHIIYRIPHLMHTYTVLWGIGGKGKHVYDHKQEVELQREKMMIQEESRVKVI